MSTKTIEVSSVFPAAPEAVWDKLMHYATLEEIAAPKATFVPCDKSVDEFKMTWEADKQYAFELKLGFGLHAGVHHILITELNPEEHRIQTKESNSLASQWDHTITLRPVPTGDKVYTSYTDKVVLNAGWKTFLVAFWTKRFLAHRQQQWVRLLTEKPVVTTYFAGKLPE